MGVREQKCLKEYRKENKAVETIFQKPHIFSQSVLPLSRNRDPNVTQNGHVYVICCRPEVPDHVIYGKDVDTVVYNTYYQLFRSRSCMTVERASIRMDELTATTIRH